MENEVLKMYEYAEQTIEISLVKEEEIPVMLELMNAIYQELPDKSWFSMDSEENLIRYMSTSGFALKAQVFGRDGQGKLAAVFVARTSELGEENHGKYMNLKEKNLERVAHMEIAMVDKKFRGRGLQKKLMEVAEDRLELLGFRWLMGTAHPENVYSVHNFQKLGYEIVAEALKYGGFLRYVFCKEI